MTSVQLEGAIDDISPKQLEFIKSVVEKRGFRESTAVIETLGAGGDGYMASVKRISAEKDGWSFKAILKLASTVEMVRKKLNTAALFQNEHVMYTEMFPKYAELEKDVGISRSERLRYAKCYGSQIENGHEVIILEDLKDYVMLDKYKPLPNKAVELFLANLAKLHSIAYVLKNQEPDTFKELEKSIVNIYELENYIKNMSIITAMFEADMLNLFESEKYKRAFRGVVSQMTTLMKEAGLDDVPKYSVFIHGDAWTNNAMFRLEGDEIIDCCLIDYQISALRSPVTDIYFMIFQCTDFEDRSKHFHEWIDYYYSELGKRLSAFNLDVDEVYPRDQLDEDLRRYSKASLALLSLMSFFFIRESADAAKVKADMEETFNDMEKHAESLKITLLDDEIQRKFKTKMEGIVDSFIELGFLSA